MAELTKEQVEAVLKEIQDPNIDKNLIASNAVKNIDIDAGNIKVEIILGYPAKTIVADLAEEVEGALTAAGAKSAKADISWNIEAHSVQKSLKPLDNIKNVIAVASGKGGVGKSTTAINLALALSMEGAVVGLLDADIYGPSQPRMLGVSGQPKSIDGKSLEPMEAHGLQAMSIGFLIDEETPMIWRGPMVTQALEQLLNDTKWRGLDYLIVDLPPGTGDVQTYFSAKNSCKWCNYCYNSSRHCIARCTQRLKDV